jgi:N-formylglutamate amidohydrolase
MTQNEETPPDPRLAALIAEPCRVLRPRVPAAPFVFASPHSGRSYPQAFLAESQLSPRALRRSEDAFVEELFAPAMERGAPLLMALFPRVFVDANRAPCELDPAMFDGPLAPPVEPASARVQAGLGVIPRVVREGVEVYRGKLKPAEAEARLEAFHRPYHAALEALVAETRARFGSAIVVDCHSMPSAANVCDIVLGDRHGSTASPGLVRHAELAFAAEGFSVARNTPYAGGYTTLLYGRPQAGIQALQIEVNRALYLDEERVEKLRCFDAVRARIDRALERLLRYEANAQHPPLAAE